jgi:hypothetical protein
LPRTRNDLVLDVRGDDGDRHFGPENAQFAGEFQPVLARHVEVDKRHVGSLGLDQREGLGRSVGLDLAPLRLQFRERLAGHDPRQLAIIDDHDGDSHGNSTCDFYLQSSADNRC